MVGQLFMPYVYGSGATQVTADQRAANLSLFGQPTPEAVVRAWHLGGIILIDHNPLDPQRPTLSTGNVGSAEQITALTRGLQQVATRDSGQPLLVSTDQEGGSVQRITNGVTALPSEATMAAQGTAALTCTYHRLGQQLLALGVNLDFAPVADVASIPTSAIGDRSFGPSPTSDANDVGAAVLGLQSAGVLATLKHWPGLGSTSVDSHLALPVLQRDRATWERTDRVPFAHNAPHAAAIMVAHLAFPAVDPSGRPATFSPLLDRELLRKGLGYHGLVITDSLWMEPARAIGPPGIAALRALDAGTDVLLEPPDIAAAYGAVLHAVRTNPHVAAEVRAAVTDVLTAKRRIGRRDEQGVPASCR
jgi:beta-N-acetylhexosaminidase